MKACKHEKERKYNPIINKTTPPCGVKSVLLNYNNNYDNNCCWYYVMMIEESGSTSIFFFFSLLILYCFTENKTAQGIYQLKELTVRTHPLRSKAWYGIHVRIAS